MSNMQSLSSADMRCFAYKVGYMSKYRIEREARKTEPRLFKLIGHASLFDSAKKYIVEHLDDEDDEDIEDAVCCCDNEDDGDDLPCIDQIDELDLDGDDLQVPDELPSYTDSLQQYQYYQATTKTMTSPTQRPQPLVLATPAEDDDFHSHPHYEAEDWENVSDVSTEAGDDDDSDSDSDWSQSTRGDDDDLVDPATARQSSHHHHHNKIVDLCALATSQFDMPKYQPLDDDLVLWAQQPKVFSQRQADNLLLEVLA